MLPEVIVNNVPSFFNFLKSKYEDLEFRTEEELGIIYDDYLDYSKKSIPI